MFSFIGKALGLGESSSAKRAREEAAEQARLLREENARMAAKKEAEIAEKRKKVEKLRITGLRTRSSSRKGALGGDKDSLGGSKTLLG